MRTATRLTLYSLATASKAVVHPWNRAGYAGASPYTAEGGNYSGPFTLLTDSFLNVVDLNDGFGPEDKLQSCLNQL